MGVRERDRDPTRVDPGRQANALPVTLGVGRGGCGIVIFVRVRRSDELVQIVGATRTPAIGRPCSSRTRPPIDSAAGRFRMYFAGISPSLNDGLRSQTRTGT